MNRKWLTLTSFLLSLVLVLSACGQNGEKNTEKSGDQATDVNTETITFGMNNWAENIAVSNMWKILLEERGFNVELKKLNKAAVWTGLAQNQLDVVPEVWLPYTDKSYWKEYKDQVDMRDTWYEGTGLGLVVPKYVKIDSITELNKNKKKFDGTIVGIEPGASLMDLTRKALKKYNLDYKLKSSSTPAMMATLKRAYKAKKPVLVTLWNPHWAFAQFDLKYLKDPKNVYGDADDIYYMTREEFADEYPKVVKWMDHWKMDHKSLASLMAKINEVGDAHEGAKKWIEANQDLVKSWFESGKKLKQNKFEKQ